MADYLIGLVTIIVQLVSAILILNVLASFFVDPWHPARRFLDQLAEPLLRPARNLLPPTGMFDLSPMVTLIVLQIINQVLVQMIHSAFRG